MLEHPRRYDRRTYIQTLDPDNEAQEIYRLLTLFELPWEMTTALNLALFRSFAAPRISGLLAHTGEMQTRPAKRAWDTGLLMYELYANGFDHERGRQVVRSLNRMHHRWNIENEDYLYVLATFVVVPTRWINAHGWRSLTPQEQRATATFYRTLGRHMAIQDLPATYDEFAAFFDAYESEHLAPTASAAGQMQATLQVFADRLPRALHPATQGIVSSLLSDSLRRCLDVPAAPPVIQYVVDHALTARGVVVRRMPPRSSPWFTPGEPNDAYPDGYRVADLGPDSSALAAQSCTSRP